MPEIGLETARRARTEGADVVLTGRNADRLEQAALEVGARSTAAFDVNDAPALKRFFDEMPEPIDHVLVTGPAPTYGPLLEMTGDQVRREVGDHLALGLEVARKCRPQDEARRNAVTYGRHRRPQDQSPAGDCVSCHGGACTVQSGGSLDQPTSLPSPCT